MKFELNDRVWVIDSTPNATEPCETCGLSDIKKDIKLVEAEVSDIYSHVSSTGNEEHKYRVRVDDQIKETFWRDGIDIFDSLERANKALENKKRQL